MDAIRFDSVRFTYDAAHNALDGATLAIPAGSYVCVVGGNGSGKSTLAKHMNALLAPDEGTVEVFGLDTAVPENVFPVRETVGMVFQNPDDQLVSSVIEDDIAFGPENLGLEPMEIRARVTQALTEVGLQGFEQRECYALSGGQKQRVAIAGVLAMEPRVIVFDEASAMLDPRGRNGLARISKTLNEQGLTIVAITHFMEEAASADRVIVMKDGHIAADGTPADVLCDPQVLEPLALEAPFSARLTARLAQAGMPVRVYVDEENALAAIRDAFDDDGQTTRGTHVERTAQDAADASCESGQEQAHALVEFSNVSFSYEPVRTSSAAGAPPAPAAQWGNAPDDPWALRDISFSLFEGDFFGIAGHTGSGKSTLIQLANGLLQPTEGTVRASGTDLSDKKAAAEARRTVGVIFQYPEHQLFAATVFDDVAFGPRNLGLSEAEVEQRVREACELVHLDFDDVRARSPFSLSGGQQRRVAFAGVLAMQPSVLLLDEPMAGLDPQARKRFIDLLRELHDERGLTVAVVSHSMDDLAYLCNRILVLDQGRKVMLGTPERIFADEEALHNIGLGIPQALHFVHALEESGIALTLAQPIPGVDDLAEAIVRAWRASGAALS